MDINYNQLIQRYSKADIEFDSMYHFTVPANSKVYGGKTMKETCGFVIPMKGKARFRLMNVDYILEPGVIMHAGPNMLLDKEVIGQQDWEFTLIHYRVKGSKEEKRYLENLHCTINVGACSTDINKLLQQLYLSERNPAMINQLKSKVLFFTFIESIFQDAQEKNHTTDEDIVKDAINYIEENHDKNITVTELAEKNNMDSKRFYYIFQKSVGICPKQYIMRCRINNAREILIAEQYSVAEIAAMVGYEDAFHFSRIFKKSTGISPSGFRKKFGKNAW